MKQRFKFGIWGFFKPTMPKPERPKKTALETFTEKAYQYYRTLTPKEKKQFIHNLKNLNL